MRNLYRAILLIFLFFYFGMAALYLLPVNPLKNYLAGDVGRKFEEVFYQKWNFFAEPGNVYLSLVVKCGDSDEWLDPVSRILNQHQNYRLPSDGKLLYHYKSYGTIGNSLIRESNKENSNKRLIAKYKELIASFSREACMENNLEEGKIELALLYRKVRKFSKRTDQNIFDSHEVH